MHCLALIQCRLTLCQTNILLLFLLFQEHITISAMHDKPRPMLFIGIHQMVLPVLSSFF